MVKAAILNILHSLPAEDRERINRQRIVELLLRLSARDRYILRLRYGLDGQDVHTQEQIGSILGVSQQSISWRLRRIRQIPT